MKQQPELIVMLTYNDLTVPNAAEIFERCRATKAAYWGFKEESLPVLDGYAATAVLRKLPGGEKLKIFAFSANAFEEDREKSLKAGMNGHITKPLKIDDLVNLLARASAND